MYILYISLSILIYICTYSICIPDILYIDIYMYIYIIYISDHKIYIYIYTYKHHIHTRYFSHLREERRKLYLSAPSASKLYYIYIYKYMYI